MLSIDIETQLELQAMLLQSLLSLQTLLMMQTLMNLETCLLLLAVLKLGLQGVLQLLGWGLKLQELGFLPAGCLLDPQPSFLAHPVACS